MTYRAKQLVANLREHAEWALANEWETPITLGDNLTEAANLIENLSAELARDERQYYRDALLEADRDAWKRRCEAAERELKTLRPCYCCKYYRKELAQSGEESDPVCCENCVIASKWQWRGLCAENGGIKP